MRSYSLSGGIAAAASVAIVLITASCANPPPRVGAGTPFSLGGTSQVLGFTPTPTAAVATPGKEGSPTASKERTQAPSGGSPVAGGLEIGTVGNDLAFDKPSLSAASGSQVRVTLHNKAIAAVQHNWVLVKKGTEGTVADAGAGAGPANAYVPVNNHNVIAHTKLLDGGKRESVLFTAPKAGTYTYLCSFPGHYAAGMHGEFVSE